MKEKESKFPNPILKFDNKDKFIHYIYDENNLELLPYIKKVLNPYKEIKGLEIDKEQIMQICDLVLLELNNEKNIPKSLVRAMVIAEAFIN